MNSLFFDIAEVPSLGHFLIETITRLWYKKEKIDTMHFMTKCPEYLLYYLARFNIQKSDICVSDGIIFCKELIIPKQSIAHATSVHNKTEDIFAKIFQFGQKNKVYLARSKVSKRKLINEYEIEQIMENYGFTIVHPQDLPIKEQVQICANASHIVGCVGTQMLHRLGDKKKKVLYIAPQKFPSMTAYMNIEKFYANNFNVIYGHYTQNNHSLFSSQWVVDVENFRGGLENWLNTCG